ncbi:MAG: hypothetical protein JRH18_07665 [Deltaproteobacteria bacterium]|nr:hypothetical protein [Deltaproteobacteria bacterium]MBW1995485.1 hypothetical protein [Deltaproteobacteria bacterium]MBW2151529.1 hypothetical protein [Deltaproteobacteria bacterium]
MKQQLAISNPQPCIEASTVAGNHFYCVEFFVNGANLLYQSRLWSRSPESMFALVKEDSDILNWIQVGDVLNMKYYSEDDLNPTRVFNTKIQYITRDENGRFNGHYLLGLSIIAD